LQLLFAKMGFPLTHAKQNFSLIPTQYKKNLKHKLTLQAPAFNLLPFSYPSFHRTSTTSSPLSAADTVYLLNALLHVSNKPTISSALLQENFWRSYDALDNEKSALEGIKMAIDLQQSLVSLALGLLNRGEIIQLAGPFRYAILEESEIDEMKLEMLARFLVDTFVESGKGDKPFILCALVGEMYIVIGMDGKHSGERKQMNKFGAIFTEAGRRVGVDVGFVSWNVGIVRIGKADIIAFMEYLRSGLSMI